MDFKEMVKMLSDPDIKKKDYNDYLEKINDKVNEIWRFICSDRNLIWWSFDNDSGAWNSGGNGSDGGEFDPIEHAEMISIIGEFNYVNNGYYEYNDGFPTRFLWEDYKKEVIEHQKLSKKKEEINKKLEKEKKAVKKTKKIELLKSIKSKLTAEELKFLKIK